MRQNPAANPINPWRFQSKRHIDELIYFGQRFYKPDIGKWLTQDPKGYQEGPNLYQFAKNNPFKYYDPRGANLFGYCVGLGEIALGGTLVLSGAARELTTCGAYTPVFGPQAIVGAALMVHGASAVIEHSHDLYPGTNISRKILDLFDSITYNSATDTGKDTSASPDVTSQEKESPRTEPKNLGEQLALEEAEANEGQHIMKDTIKDSRRPKNEWKKMQYEHKSLDGSSNEVHYWENISTGEREGFKLKDKD